MESEKEEEKTTKKQSKFNCMNNFFNQIHKKFQFKFLISVYSFYNFNFGIDVKRDEEKSSEICMLGCSKGSRLAKGLKYLFGFNTKVDNVRAHQILNEIVEKGDNENEEKKYSLFILGKCHTRGVGTEKNNHKALEYFEKAVELGETRSMHNLGELLLTGKGGVKRNVPRAIELFEKAALQNDSYSICFLAKVYQSKKFEKDGLKKDLHKAIEYHEKAIQMGNDKSIRHLATIYENGDEEFKIERDVDKSCSIYFQSCDTERRKKSKSIFRIFISQYVKEITWKKEYHSYWPKEKILNDQIILILLISKYRKEFRNRLFDSVFLKGISFKIIQFLSHISFTKRNLRRNQIK